MRIDIQSDSRKVLPGDTFIAIKGIDRDGHDYIEKAIENGATKIIAEHGNYSVETVIVDDTEKYLIDYLHEHYDSYISKLKLIGITGTNGKTTSAFLLHMALNQLGKKTGYIGTVGFYVKDKIRSLDNTTPNLYTLYSIFLECIEMGVEQVVLEVSSQAICGNRVKGLLFDYAIFTNLTEDHLDFHKTMENYALAKQKLFYQLEEDHTCFINCDDSYASYFLLEQNHNLTYGTKNSNYKISNIQVDISNTTFQCNGYRYQMKLLGKYNVYNMVCVIALLSVMNFTNEQIKNVIKNLEPPKGRMEVLSFLRGKIVIDYAHTPDAVQQTLLTAREIPHQKIYTIVGCGGDRDPLKRPIMGEIATSLSDFVIFTSDNPRTEDPFHILKDITADLQKNNFTVIENRKDAINKGIQMMKKNDILLVLGKGHENYQIIGNTKFDFDDKIVVETKIQEICKE